MFKIKESDTVIEKRMMSAICDHLNDKFRILIRSIRKLIQPHILGIFQRTHTYNELVYGFLLAEFGFYKSSAKKNIDTILQSIVDHTEILFKPVKVFGSKLSGGLSIGILRKDLSDVLYLNEASVTTRDGTSLPWLSWLLEEGNHYIIRGFQILYKAGAGRSREAIMVASDRGKWRVPPYHAGTIRNNWLTRTLDIFGNFLCDRIAIIIKQGLV